MSSWEESFKAYGENRNPDPFVETVSGKHRLHVGDIICAGDTDVPVLTRYEIIKINPNTKHESPLEVSAIRFSDGSLGATWTLGLNVSIISPRKAMGNPMNKESADDRGELYQGKTLDGRELYSASDAQRAAAKIDERLLRQFDTFRAAEMVVRKERGMTQQATFEAIDTELHYQERETAKSDRPDMLETMSMGDILGAIKVNLDRAYAMWYSDGPPNYGEVTPYLRKIAALCVRAGIQFVLPKRKLD